MIYKRYEESNNEVMHPTILLEGVKVNMVKISTRILFKANIFSGLGHACGIWTHSMCLYEVHYSKPHIIILL